MTLAKKQNTDEIIDVAPYFIDVYGEGAREKRLCSTPSDIPYSFCAPSHLYIFKLSRAVYPEQFWIEIFAYHLGCLMNVPVPPAFAAYDSISKTPGAFIEWFYDQDIDSYERGSDIMQRLIENYEIDRGEQHNFKSISGYFETLRWKTEDWLIPWVKILTFDAIIGNSDRHQGNWGIITLNKDNPNKQTIKMSPAFDNGTSMGIEIPEDQFPQFDDIHRMERYVDKGQPHLSLELILTRKERKNRDNHENLLKKIVGSHPQTRQIMIECISFPIVKVNEILEALCRFDMTYRLTEARAVFMLKLLKFRQERLLASLGAL